MSNKVRPLEPKLIQLQDEAVLLLLAISVWIATIKTKKKKLEYSFSNFT
jgi:hypothetical protein